MAHTRDQDQWNRVGDVGAHNVLWVAPTRRSAGKGNALRCGTGGGTERVGEIPPCASQSND
jgi:hypothetical protein